MGKGKITRAIHQERSLGGKDFKHKWDLLCWVGGGLLSHFPFLFAPVGIFFLGNSHYRTILTDYVSGGELIWIAVVFLIITIGNTLTDFLNSSKRSNLSIGRVVLLLSGGMTAFFCSWVYVVRKGRVEPLSAVFSIVLWIVSMSISFGLFNTRES